MSSKGGQYIEYRPSCVTHFLGIIVPLSKGTSPAGLECMQLVSRQTDQGRRGSSTLILITSLFAFSAFGESQRETID